MTTKQEFFHHMSELFEEVYDDPNGYKTYKEVSSLKNKSQIKEMKALTKMGTEQRLLYRHSLASNGRELTPRQLDQYLAIIDYALEHKE